MLAGRGFFAFGLLIVATAILMPDWSVYFIVFGVLPLTAILIFASWFYWRRDPANQD